MAKITNEQIHEAYAYAKKVHSEALSIKEAKNLVSKNSGMDQGSAQGYINTCLKMMSGNGYTWTINAYGTDYFLEKIYDDFGVDAFLTSMASVKKHLEYYEGVGKSAQPKIRSVLKKHYQKIEEKSKYEELQHSFEQQVRSSTIDKQSNRLSRLKVAPKNPQRIESTITFYQRNPDVVAEVLLRANGICENCMKPAPFHRAKDNTPFLEVHHKKQLASGGEDSVTNAIALCPNCHRKEHYG